jgi:hypothetical protein
MEGLHSLLAAAPHVSCPWTGLRAARLYTCISGSWNDHIDTLVYKI